MICKKCEEEYPVSYPPSNLCIHCDSEPKTKLSFRVKRKDGKYISGYQELQTYGMGVMNDVRDPTKISICFFKDKDDYLRVERVEE